MSLFHAVGNLHPSRSFFDLSYLCKTTMDMGKLYPVQCDELLPGDQWSISHSAFIRFQPMVAPAMHEINVYAHVWVVPYRLLWEDWEDFITGGKTGDFTAEIPTWKPDPSDPDNNVGTLKNGKKTLWDYFGFPVNVNPKGAYPIDFPRRAYNLIYNEYYRDQNLEDEIDLANQEILIRAWEKDYFTSALVDLQRGTSPSLPVSGNVEFLGLIGYDPFPIVPSVGASNFFISDPETRLAGYQGTSGPNISNSNQIKAWFNNNKIDATTFDATDLRLTMQIQKYLERNARVGARYPEQLRGRWNVVPEDARLQRPEYIGGTRFPVTISEVVQTSEDGSTPQGNMAGHGISADHSFAGRYYAREHCLMMTIVSIMPRPVYQQGINRQWLRRTRFDFPTPEFVNLSEQAITNAELFATNDEARNKDIFAYIGMYDECRYKPSMVTGDMRDDFSHWHISRIFDPSTPPVFNNDFIKCRPRKDIFAVPSEDGFLVDWLNIIDSNRPLPIMAEPGLMDHH